MVNLYVTSSQEGAGKTTLCAGVGKHLQKSGKKVGYLKLAISSKPHTLTPYYDTGLIRGKPDDGDAAFMKRIFGLQETADDICPVLDGQNTIEKVKQAFAKVALGKDVVIVEGLPFDTSSGIVEALGARVIVVEGYASERALSGYKIFGTQLLGVAINKAPKGKVARVQSQALTELSQPGINLLGALPEDRTLVALTIGELAELVKGKFLDGANRSDELIENFMLGAMTIDPGPLYYSRKSEKAVLVRSDRPDMQMAALETPTKCLVLVGNTPPIRDVLTRAQTKKVPVILASGDIKGLATTIENAFSQAKFNQDKKLTKLGEIMGQSFNFKAAYQGLGLAA